MDANELLNLAPTGTPRAYFVGVLASVLETDGQITPESWADAARRSTLYASENAR